MVHGQHLYKQTSRWTFLPLAPHCDFPCRFSQHGDVESPNQGGQCPIWGQLEDIDYFFLRHLFHRHWSHGQIPCLRGRRLGWGGSSPRASARRSKKGGGSPSVWSVAPKGSSSRLALKARWAVQLKRAAQRRV